MMHKESTHRKFGNWYILHSRIQDPEGGGQWPTATPSITESNIIGSDRIGRKLAALVAKHHAPGEYYFT